MTDRRRSYSSEEHRGGGGFERDRRRRDPSMIESSSIPQVNTIFQGTVVSIMDYGAFIRIPGCIKNGLVHISQLSKFRVDNVSEVVSVNDHVWCKVVSLGEDSNKISLSMKSVNQGTGKDMDPNGVQAGLDENRRKTYVPFSQPKIQLDAVFNTVCKKCNTKGHLAQNCFQSSSGKSYQLIGGSDDDDDDDDDDNEEGKRAAGISAEDAPGNGTAAVVDSTRKAHKKKGKSKKHRELKSDKAKRSTRAKRSSSNGADRKRRPERRASASSEDTSEIATEPHSSKRRRKHRKER